MAIIIILEKLTDNYYSVTQRKYVSGRSGKIILVGFNEHNSNNVAKQIGALIAFVIIVTNLPRAVY